MYEGKTKRARRDDNKMNKVWVGLFRWLSLKYAFPLVTLLLRIPLYSN
jgi:hypothetical protein